MEKKRASAASGPAADSYAALDPERFARNMMRVGVQTQQIVGDFIKRQAGKENNGPLDPLNVTGAFLSLAKAMAGNREAVMNAQLRLWQDFMGLWEGTARRMMGGSAEPIVMPAPGDKRFRAPDWQQNEIFDFIKQSYLLTANAVQNTVAGLEGLEPAERQRVEFYTRQFADAFAPTNFILTNPEVMRATIQSNGENLVHGLDNLIDDIERGKGQLSIRQSADAFTVGENIATAPGKVIFRNEFFELLQYAPTTDEVYERPLLIFPPWINKFYILDLRPENSFIRWLVGQGYTVFVVSWVNPDARLSKMGFEDYMREGVFAALDAVERATGVADPNAVGYCIGGTLLTISLAWLAAHGDKTPKGHRVNSATFWAAQADFSEAGELSVFVDEAQLDALQQQMEENDGVLKGSKMANAFNLLRANDLIWSFVINNYMLGKQPMPFDLLYWNSDTTRMPETLHLSYLRQCYKENALASGQMTVGGTRLDLSKIKVPAYMQSAKEDHIAPYRSVYKMTHIFQGPVRYVLAGSGHIAGVINPPAAKKYQYWTNEKFGEKAAKNYPPTADQWREGAIEHPGSWWTDWDAWLSKKSGKKIPARKPGDGSLQILGDAPGTYVRVKAS